MKRETRFYEMKGVEVRAKEGDANGNTATGYAAVFNSDSEDLGGFIERILPGAFTRSLTAANNGSLNIYALWSHDSGQPLGSTGSKRLKLSEDEHGLSFEMNTGRMTDAQKSALAEGDLRMSFGFVVRDQEWKELDDGSVERTIIECDLFEISFVISPAYPDTEAALRSLEAWRDECRDMKIGAEMTEAVLAAEAVEEVRGNTEEEIFEELRATTIDTCDRAKRAGEAILRAKKR